MENQNQSYFIGRIVSVNNDYESTSDDDLLNKRNYHEITATIPGYVENVVARPVSGLNDEPKIGDTVLLYCLDPIFHSAYVYQKLKENDFIGIRAAGKSIDITENAITISVYDKDKNPWGENENIHPTNRDENGAIKKDDDKTRLKASITIKDNGEIEIYAEKGIKLSSGTPVPDRLVNNDSTYGFVLKNNGGADGTDNGGFCAITTCPYIKANHTSSWLRDTNNDKNQDK